MFHRDLEAELLKLALGINNTVQLSRDPLRGNLVENLIFLELVKFRLNQVLDSQLYFFRDTHGHKVDLIYQSGSQLVPIEIKALQTFHKDFLQGLRFFQQLVGERSARGYLIYSGDHEQRIETYEVLNYLNAIKALVS
jgi:uncharacterized protein